MGAPLRLLMATARYFPYMGGIEAHVYEVGRRLAAAGVDVTVLTTDPSGRLLGEEQMDGVSIRRVRSWPSKEDFYFAPGLLRVIGEGGWDLIHCQGCHTFVPPLVMSAALRARIPYIVTFHTGGHSSRLRNALRGVQWTALTPLLRRAEHFIAVSQFELEFFRRRLRLPAERFTFSPNGSDLPAPGSLPGTHDGDTLIVSVGRLERFKGHHRVLAALPDVLAQRPDVRLQILGTGPYEAELRRQARALGVANRVEITAVPATDRRGMASALSKAALVVLLSEAESNPVAVMEAAALGRSVLVAHTSGLRELAERGYVRSIPLESTNDAVAAAIVRQLGDPHVPPALKLPTWDDCTAHLLAVYSNIVGRPVCAS